MADDTRRLPGLGEFVTWVADNRDGRRVRFCGRVVGYDDLVFGQENRRWPIRSMINTGATFPMDPDGKKITGVLVDVEWQEVVSGKHWGPVPGLLVPRLRAVTRKWDSLPRPLGEIVYEREWKI